MTDSCIVMDEPLSYISRD